MNKKQAIIFIVCIALLLLSASGCEKFKQKVKDKNAEKKALKDSKQERAKSVINASAEEDIKAILDATKEDAPQEQETPFPTEHEEEDGCTAVLRQIEAEIEQARNASQELDRKLAATTEAYVKAQEDYENAVKTSNAARINSANASLRRTQGDWEDSRVISKEGREEVKRLKLVLVKAKDDCDPTYVAPYEQNQTAQPVQQTSSPATSVEDICATYTEANVTKDLNAANKKLQEFEDELQQLEDEKEAAENANDKYKVQDLEKEIAAVTKDISRKQGAIRELENRLKVLERCPTGSNSTA